MLCFLLLYIFLIKIHLKKNILFPLVSLKEITFRQDLIDEFNKQPNILSMFESLSDESLEATKALILKMEEGKALLANAVKYRAPYMLCKYLTELANSFHHFYNYTRVLSEDKKDSLMKLSLVNCFRIIMATMLNLIGVNPVEKM